MRGFRQSWEVLIAVVTLTLLTCSCAGKKPTSAQGQPEKNPEKYEVFLTQLYDVAIVGDDLLFVGKARVAAEASSGVTKKDVSAEVKVPYQESCFSLIKGGLPPGKELRIAGRGWYKSKPIQGGDAISAAFIGSFSCEVTQGP